MSNTSPPADERLRKKSDFRTLFRSGKRFRASFLSVQVIGKTEEGSCRAAFVVSRRVGNAVIRNRIKRRLREVYRKRATDLPGRLDLAFVAEKGIDRCDFSTLESEMARLLRQVVKRYHD